MMKKLWIALLFVLAFSTCASYAATSDAIDAALLNQVCQTELGIGYAAPYVLEDTVQVDPRTGGLNVLETDLHLPGKNGLDLTVRRRYNNQSYGALYSGVREKEQDFIGETKAYLFVGEYSGTEVRAYFRFDKEETLLEQHPVLGYADGRDVTDRYYQVRDDNGNRYYEATRLDEEDDGYEDTIAMYRDLSDEPMDIYYLDKNAAAEPVKSGNVELGWNMELVVPGFRTVSSLSERGDGYLDVDRHGIFRTIEGEEYYGVWYYSHSDDRYYNTFAIDSKRFKTELPQTARSETIIDEKDGFEYFIKVFDDKGRTYYLNQVGQFRAIEDAYGNRILYSGSAWTDTYGRIIKPSKTGITVDGETVVEYIKTTQNDTTVDAPADYLETDNRYFLTVRKHETDSTYQDTVYRSFVATDYDSYRKFRTYNIDLIGYPDGLQRSFEYVREYKLPFTSVDALKNVSKMTDTHNGVTLQDLTYSYPSRSVLRTVTASRSDSATYTTQVDDALTERREVYTYNKNDLLKSHSLRKGSTGVMSTSYEYVSRNSWVRPSTVTVKETGTNTVSFVTTYTYDERDNVISETVDGFTTTYDYGTWETNPYNRLLSTSYQQDADTTILQENTLSEDKKSVVSSVIKENGTEAAKTEYTYDTYGNPATTKAWKDSSSFVTTQYSYTYPEGGNTVVSQSNVVTAADGTTSTVGTSQTYDKFGNLISATDGNNNITTYTYDKVNRLTGTTYPDNSTQLLSYDTANNTLLVTLEDGSVLKLVYNAYGSLTKAYAKIDGVFKLIEESVYDANNRVIETKQYFDDTNYRSLLQTYDVRDRVITRTLTDNGTEVMSEAITYSPKTNTAEMSVLTTRTTTDSVPLASVKVFYDRRLNQPLEQQLIDPADSTVLKKATYTYDNVGNLLTVKDPRYYDEEQTGAYTAAYTYDFGGRVLTETNAIGGVKSYTYDRLGSMLTATDELNTTTTFAYDELGREIRSTAPFNNVNMNYVTNQIVEKYYDGNNNLIKTVGPQDCDDTVEDMDDVITMRYEYDSRNRMTRNINHTARDIYAYYYDVRGNMTSEYYWRPNIGWTQTEPEEEDFTRSYTYDQFGNRTSFTDLEGSESYTYDYMGRMTQKTMRDNTPIAYTYDVYDNILLERRTVGGTNYDRSYIYDKAGQMRSISAEGKIYNYSYDVLGRMTRRTEVDTIAHYTYNANDATLSFRMTTGAGLELYNQQYTYDLLGRITNATAPSSGMSAISYTYDAAGNLLTETVGSRVTSYTYNLPYSVAQKTVTQGEATLFDEKYSYYLDNKLYEVVDTLTNRTVNYIYNRSRTLTNETIGNGTGVNNSTILYSVENGTHGLTYMNRDFEGGTNDYYTYFLGNGFHRLFHENSNTLYNAEYMEKQFTFDTNGNLTKEVWYDGDSAEDTLLGERSFTYNGYGQMTGVSTTVAGEDSATYSYTPDGLRYSKSVNGALAIRHHYMNGNMILERQSGGILRVYNRVGNRLYEYKEGDTVYGYITNFRGDVKKVVNAAGETVTIYTYNAYGEILETESTITDNNPFRYAGEYYDTETDLIYLRNRYYDPHNGHFTQEDPAKDGLNWYAYCGGDPVNFVDPWGLSIVLQGTGDEVQGIWQNIQKLTDDNLVLVQLGDQDNPSDEYVIRISQQNNGTHPSGTNMIRALIDDNLICYISVAGTDEGGQQIGSQQKAIDYENAVSGRGTGSTVKLNLNTNVSVLTKNQSTGEIQEELVPKHIELGHELIHALRAMEGNTKHYTAVGTYAFTTSNGKIRTSTFRQEELETTGISYYPGNEYSGNPVNAWSWRTTENSLRDEHGLNRRVEY